MDFTRGLRGSGADRDGPCADFLHPCGEVGLQVQQLVTGADNAVQARLFQTQLGHKLIAVGIVQLGDIGLNGGANGDDHRTFGGGDFADFIEIGVVLKAVFVDVGDIHGRLQGQEAQVFNRRFVFFGQVFQRTQHTGVFQLRQAFFQRRQLGFRVFIAAFGFLLHAVDSALAGIQVGERQLGVDNLDIVSRIHFIVNVDDVVVFETAHDVADSFGFADVGQKLVAQTFTFRRAFYQARDIDEFHRGRQNALRFDDFSQFVQTRIGHRHDTGVRLNGTEREVGRFNTCFGERIEQGGFADVGQTDDTAFESHDLNHLNLWIINLLQRTDCRKVNSFAYYTRCVTKIPHADRLLRFKSV